MGEDGCEHREVEVVIRVGKSIVGGAMTTAWIVGLIANVRPLKGEIGIPGCDRSAAPGDSRMHNVEALV